MTKLGIKFQPHLTVGIAANAAIIDVGIGKNGGMRGLDKGCRSPDSCSIEGQLTRKVIQLEATLLLHGCMTDGEA